MTRVLGGLLCVLVVLAIGVTTLASHLPSIVTNGSFEGGLTGWTADANIDTPFFATDGVLGVRAPFFAMQAPSQLLQAGLHPIATTTRVPRV